MLGIMVLGAADNTLRLWAVVYEFPTAVKRVPFNETGSQVVCITEQRMGYQCTIRLLVLIPVIITGHDRKICAL
jgi:hypothetical protein